MHNRVLLYLSVVFSVGAFLSGMPVSSHANVPQLMNYQGILLDSNGDPVSTAVDVMFTIYDAPSAGVSQWTETRSVTPDEHGRFNVLLGEVNAIGDAAFNGSDRWLEIEMVGSLPMKPRVRIVTVAYAHRISTIDGSSGGTISGDVAIQSNLMVSGAIDADGQESKIRFHYDDLPSLPSAIDYHGMFAHVHSEGKAYYAHAGNWVPLADEAHAHVVTTAEIQNGTILLEDLGQNGATDGQILKWDDGTSQWIVASEFDDDWVLRGKVLSSGDIWGLARAGNKLWGSRDSTHVNFGVACTTGSSGNDYEYLTISGGLDNNASHNYATVGGGHQNDAYHDYATVSGGRQNVAGYKATVCGGEENAAGWSYVSIGGGYQNQAVGDYAVISGGLQNSIGSGTVRCAIGGGQGNTISSGNHWHSTIGGGAGNTASAGGVTIGGGDGNAASGGGATVGGGVGNTASGDINFARNTVCGGSNNTVTGRTASICGGRDNTANGQEAMVAGGFSNNSSGSHSFTAGNDNSASGSASFALGTGAQATHNGAFVWRSPGSPNVTSERDNQFRVLAGGGVRLDDDTAWVDFRDDGTDLMNTSTGAHLTVGGAWTNASDENLKENFTSVDSQDLLEKLAALSIREWNYKAQGPDVRHIGPTAQDFHALFGVGTDDKSISTIDPSGIALAAIQGLHAQNTQQREKIEGLEAQIAELRAIVIELLGTQQANAGQ